MMAVQSIKLPMVVVVSLYAALSQAVVPGSHSANDINERHKKFSFNNGGTLYPQESETRDLRKLDGIWNFRKSPTDPEYGYRHGWYEQDLDKVHATCWLLIGHRHQYEDPCTYVLPVWYLSNIMNGCWLQILDQLIWMISPQSKSNPFKKYAKYPGFIEKWFKKDLDETGPVIPMPVPSSYNDVGEDGSLRDHVGLVWYDRRFHVSPLWLQGEQRVWLRFSSVHYAAQVWVNGNAVTHHEIGHLPFEVEITDVVSAEGSNLLTVAVDNTLLSDTVPQGTVKEVIYNNQVRLEQSYTFDFFNYAGIHRSVFLYSTPITYINDVIVNTDIQGLTGFVVYNVTYKGAPKTSERHCLIQLYDKNDTLITTSNDCAGLLEVTNAHFWWPYLMHSDPGYLYTLKASLINHLGSVIDTYRQTVGIRTVTWSNTTVYLNDKPIYMRGFGMHEDSDLRGKGWDPVLWTKNFNLIRWVGANAFRTSHYPYAEEIYQLADELGIMIIDECPSGDTDLFSDSLLAKHKQSLTELIRRDKNHPSVIMWSIANEPRSQNKAADAYFGKVAKHVRSMDLSRPVTIALAQGYNADKAGQHLDVICFNRYNGWYQNTGSLLNIVANVRAEAIAWHQKHNKPVIMTEYGADTIAGLHLTPEYVWSEEYQVALMSEHFKAFDQLRKDGFFGGEFIWNFADFKTTQSITRVGGNKKGIFTRSRQPKASAHHLRRRYHQLAVADDGATAPLDLNSYTSDNNPAKHDEL